ncbi:hypothetical protein MKZ38_006669 [Zalerion maritima]|uniref:Superkiller protein 3 n=1 Tax=Zalerion maritima TaxID=339359 RepID=A0AAD5WUG5_9PEZI|nr:hypothetical protein MKZ38_006669 [Zalerion maritima]
MAPKTTIAALKAIHQSIKGNKFGQAQEQARVLLEKDPRNYQCHIFLAFSLHKTENLEDAEKIYEAATTLKDDHQAWAGLVALYEQQGPTKISQYKKAAERLCDIYGSSEEASLYKAQDIVDKFVDYARTQGTKDQYVDALGLILPDSPTYHILEGRLPHPAKTYETIANILETEEKKRINTLIGERRTRIGARFSEVTNEVKREVYSKSQVEHVYRQLINWTTDDELRHVYEDKLLMYCYERLMCAPKAQKGAEMEAVRALAEGMVIIKHPFKLAWDIAIDWKDEKEIKDWDINVLRDYCSFFPDSDLYKVITGFLTSKISPFPKKEQAPAPPQEDSDPDSDDDDGGGGVPTEVVPVTEEDRLLMMTDGIATANSIFAYLLMGEYYQHSQEYESNVELMRKALGFVKVESTRTGLSFGHTKDALNLCLGTSLVFYQTPRHHQEAKAIFDSILERDPTSTSAMIGVGLIYEEEQDYEEAIDFLRRALKRDDSNLRIMSEAAWVQALNGDHERAKVDLESCIPLIKETGTSKSTKELLALTQYRLGVCIWNIDPSKSARKSRKSGAYPLFIEALKNDIGLAPAYTMLGIYFADYTNDKKRARRCFQQAVELSPSEVEAAERLSRSFADAGSWEHVELIAQRVIDSGKVKPPPGSKRKGISWPFAALGVAELNKQDHSKSVVSFQAALRMAPENYPAWVGLGEAYANSGRYVAATKAILQAQTLEQPLSLGPDDTWFTKYMLANVKREIAEYDESIALYREVLSSHPNEEGVATALLQTLVESGFANLGKGIFGKAIDLAIETIQFAVTSTYLVATTFNFWKAVGDACALFSHVQSRLCDFPVEDVKSMVQAGGEAYAILQDVDGVATGVVLAQGLWADEERSGVVLTRCLHASILAHKMAVHVSMGDIHAQAVAYYNLGWSEYRAHVCLPQDLKKNASKYLKASMRCFKRAIELESGNSEFWNALGVVTSQTYPTVSQHAFVRSLYINERSPIAWTNIGTLGLLHKDIQLAYEAFNRAQSTDPDYSHAWVGQGFVSLLRGESKEARILFTHAVGISDASSLMARRQYSTSVFDHIISGASDIDITSLVGPLFALTQLKELDPRNDAFVHLGALFRERVSDAQRATSQLEVLSSAIETDHDTTQLPDTLGRLIVANSDLARVQMASEKFAAAIISAEAALGLAKKGGSGNISEDQIAQIHLSCHLTIGLAHFHLGNPSSAVGYFQAALDETNHNPDAACLLAQVLWATGTEDAQDQARDVLFGIVEEYPEHVPAVLLLGTISLLDDDPEAREAVMETLAALRTSEAADSPTMRRKVAEVLGALAECGDDTTNTALVEAQAEVMLYPGLPHGWSEVGQLTLDEEPEEGQYAVEMAMQVALRAVPPRGHLSAEELAEAISAMGRPADAQKAIVVAPPWLLLAAQFRSATSLRIFAEGCRFHAGSPHDRLYDEYKAMRTLSTKWAAQGA